MSYTRWARGVRNLGGFAGGTSRLARPPQRLPEPDVRPSRSSITIASATVMASSTISVTLPAGSPGDYMTLWVMSAGDDDPTNFFPAGWTTVGTDQPFFPDGPTIYAADRTRVLGDTSVTWDLESAEDATIVVVNFGGFASADILSSHYTYSGDSSPFSETEPTAWPGTTEVVAVAISESGVSWSDAGDTLHVVNAITGQHIAVRDYTGSTATMAGDPIAAMFDLYWHAIAP